MLNEADYPLAELSPGHCYHQLQTMLVGNEVEIIGVVCYTYCLMSHHLGNGLKDGYDINSLYQI